jgi:hypothetical protein
MGLDIVESGKEWTATRATEPVDPLHVPDRFLLSDLAKEWHFFTHGAFFSFAEFKYPQEDPVADWYADQPIRIDVLRQTFSRPVFEGMTAIEPNLKCTWDHILYAVRHEEWPKLHEFLGGVCAVNKDKEAFYATFSGDLMIVDPVAAEARGILDINLPLVPVTVFCVDSNRDRWEIRPPTSLISPPRFVRLPPREEIVEMARAVLKGDASQIQRLPNTAFQAHLDAYQSILRNAQAKGVPTWKLE